MKCSVLVLAALTLPALADQRGDTPGTQPSTPQEQLGKFHVPPGFEVQLVAAEPEIQKPINLNFDAAGRLWVTGSELYPWPASTDANGEPIPDFVKGWAGLVDSFKVGDKAPQPSPVGRDSVRILGDFGPDGHARKITLFADRLNIPSGIQPLPRKPGGWSGSAAPEGDSAIVYSIPNIWLISDPDGDGFAQKREPLYTGFGYTDTHGGASSFIYWIDGWIYGTHGFKNHSEVRDRNGKVTIVDSGNTYRFRPDGTAFETYAHGQTNPFGLAFDPLGNLFSADSHSKPVTMLLRGGFYSGIGKNHDGLGFAPMITDDDHGSSAIAGIAYYADDKWPEEYRGNLFNGNPVTQRINRDRLEWHGSTPKAIRMPDFLTCDDPWFRPVNLKLGPDGALYIADFYNPIIGHYEVPLTHPSRDHTHGRIWRVVWRGENASASGGGHDESGSTRAPRVVSGASPGTSSTPGAAALPSPERGAAREGDESSAGAPKTTREARVLPGVAPDLTTRDAPALVEKLADPSLEVRRLATNELVDRVGKMGYLSLAQAFSAVSTPFLLRAARGAEADGEAGRTWVGLQSAIERIEPGATSVMLVWSGSTDEDNAQFFCALPTAIARSHLRWDRELTPNLIRRTVANAYEALATNDDPHLQLVAATNISQVARTLRETLEIPSLASRARPSRAPSVPALSAEDRAFVRSKLEEVVDSILKALAEASADDVQLVYALRMALRDALRVPNLFSIAESLAAVIPPAATHLADVSLAVGTPETAAFLLTYLQRTKLETPRAGEYLKHAALHLPLQKFDEVIDLVAHASEAPLPRRIALVDALGQAARQRGMPLPDEMIAWSQRAMIEAITSNDAGLARKGVDAVRDVKLDAKLEPLTKIIRDEARPETLRVAALEAVANLPASRDILATTLADPRHFKLRKRAAELLVAGGTAEILAALPTAPFDLAQSMAGDLINHGDEACREFLDLIEAGKASPRLLRNRLIEIVLGRRAKELQARAADLTRDLPPEDERLDKLITQRAKDFAKATPNVEQGAKVFLQNCVVCHRYRNEGGNVGPNLDGVITRGAARLIEDILDPNRNVDPGFRQTIIETHDGQTLAGANVREQGDAVLLIDATGQERSVAKAEIKTRTPSPLSLMPPAFESMIAPGDFNDLLAYLLSPSPAAKQ